MKIVLAGLVHRLRGVCRQLLYGHIAFRTLDELSLKMFSHGVCEHIPIASLLPPSLGAPFLPPPFAKISPYFLMGLQRSRLCEVVRIKLEDVRALNARPQKLNLAGRESASTNDERDGAAPSWGSKSSSQVIEKTGIIKTVGSHQCSSIRAI